MPENKATVEPIDTPLPYAVFFCPGCKMRHTIGDSLGKKFYWNGNKEKPTIRPGIDVHGPSSFKNDSFVNCISVITAGEIQFFDCTHDLKWQHVPLPVYAGTPHPEYGYKTPETDKS